MARTGININISNTVLAPPASVNSNSMLIVVGAKTTSAGSGTVAFELGMPYKLTSANDLASYGITEANNKDLYEQVNDFYQPKAYVNNSGTILWIVGLADYTSKIEDKLPLWVKYTTVGGNEYRPRQILISNDPTKMTSAPDVTELQAAVMEMYAQAFSTCIITDVGVITGDISELEDLSTKASGMVGVVTFTKRQGSRAAVGAVGGWVSTLSVGTSMGDGSLSAFGTDLYFVDGTVSGSTVTWANSPCASASQATIDALSDKQYIFPISRPPRTVCGSTTALRPKIPARLCVRSKLRVLSRPSSMICVHSLTSTSIRKSRLRSLGTSSRRSSRSCSMQRVHRLSSRTSTAGTSPTRRSRSSQRTTTCRVLVLWRLRWESSRRSLSAG